MLCLCHCLEHYSPLGFEASLALLEERAGPFRDDEGALIRAVDLLERSRDAWQAELRAYAEARRRAKRRGHRTPPRSMPNPNRPQVWHGGAREAALFAIRRWSRLPGNQLPAAPEVERDVRRLVDALTAPAGLTQEDRDLLDTTIRWLDDQAGYASFLADRGRYAGHQRLRDVAHHVRVAAA